MPKKTESAPLPARTTVALTGTVSKTQAGLSFPAALALEYAQAWLCRAGSVKVPTAGLIRRALLVYVQHLHTQAQKGPAATSEEVRAVRRACKASLVSPEAQQLAQLRLYTAPHGEPLTALHTLLISPQALADMQALEERVESTCQSIFEGRGFKLSAAKAANRASLAAAPAAAQTTTTTEPTR